MPKLSQEMLAIIGVGVALAALDVTTTSALRAEIQAVRVEARADREAWRTEMRAVRAEAHADREAWRAEARAVRAEARAVRAEAHADREAWRTGMRASREEFEEHIVRLEEHVVRLTERQGALGGLVEGLGRRMSAAGPDDRPG